MHLGSELVTSPRHNTTMDQLIVEGKQIDIKSVKREINMSKFTHTTGFRKNYCITPPFGMRETAIPIQIIRNRMKKNMKKSQKKREERLQEILNAAIEIKLPKQRDRVKFPLPVTTKLYPDYKIQSQIYNNRKLSIEQLRQIFYNKSVDYDNKEDIFDLSILLPFIKTAYSRLYEQDLQILQNIVEEERPYLTKRKPKLLIKDDSVEKFIYSEDEVVVVEEQDDFHG